MTKILFILLCCLAALAGIIITMIILLLIAAMLLPTIAICTLCVIVGFVVIAPIKWLRRKAKKKPTFEIIDIN